MEFKINDSPYLSMSEITKRLFNRNFHADVQFIVEGRIIYSLELIKRSVVFEQQLEDKMGDVKLIPINDCKYESFLEFVRYVYSDECTINIDNFVDILKLANKYKFVKLENQVLQSIPNNTKWRLRCFEYCVLNKYEKAWNFIKIRISFEFDSYLKHEQFLSLHPDVVDELLKFEHVKKGVTEIEIFTAVGQWITSYCKMHQMTLEEGRQQFDKLIRKIRFPTMTNEELRQCYEKYPELLSDNDRMSIAGQAVFSISDSLHGLWITNGRKEFIWPFIYRKYKVDTEHQMLFSVSKDTILDGVRIGIEETRKPIEIEISETDDETGVCDKLKFVLKAFRLQDVIISLGQSIRLKPNFKYTIKITFLEVVDNFIVVCRNDATNVTINDPGKTVNLIEASSNMIEMFFKPVTD